jgi:hypothetical protein
VQPVFDSARLVGKLKKPQAAPQPMLTISLIIRFGVSLLRVPTPLAFPAHGLTSQSYLPAVTQNSHTQLPRHALPYKDRGHASLGFHRDVSQLCLASAVLVDSVGKLLFSWMRLWLMISAVLLVTGSSVCAHFDLAATAFRV